MAGGLLGKFCGNEGLKLAFGKGMILDLGIVNGSVWPHGSSPGRTEVVRVAQLKFLPYLLCNQTCGAHV